MADVDFQDTAQVKGYDWAQAFSTPEKEEALVSKQLGLKLNLKCSRIHCSNSILAIRESLDIRRFLIYAEFSA
jgi:hypothetical protein